MGGRFWMWGLLALAACDDGGSGGGESAADAGVADTGPTYYGQTKAIIDQKCATCHRPGDIAPFPLETYTQVKQFAGAMRYAIDSGRMPPWQAAPGCNEYQHDFSLTPEEKQILLDGLAGEVPEGDPASFVPPPAPEARPEIREDVVIELPEYTPQIRPDDYRCFIVRWPELTDRFVTGFGFAPGQPELVHHIIIFHAPAEDAALFQAMDDEDPGPGYTCYGGPTRTGSEARVRPGQWAAWAPGVGREPYAEGTGIPAPPGTVLIAQVHYNTGAAEPAADRSHIMFQVDDAVAHPAIFQLMSNPAWLAPGGMLIPAGEAEVQHSTDVEPGPFIDALTGGVEGLDTTGPLLLHSVGMHMHKLGKSGSLEVVRAGGDTECLLQIPRWDFNWQKEFRLQTPLRLERGDKVRLTCMFDNSAAHQPFVGGTQAEPTDVEWGEGTQDEMCLSIVYITSP